MNVQETGFKDKLSKKDIEPEPSSGTSRVSSLFRKKPKKVKAATSLIQTEEQPGTSDEPASKGFFARFKQKISTGKEKDQKKKKRASSIGHDDQHSEHSLGSRRHSLTAGRPSPTDDVQVRTLATCDDEGLESSAVVCHDVEGDVTTSHHDTNTSALPGSGDSLGEVTEVTGGDLVTEDQGLGGCHDETWNCRYRDGVKLGKNESCGDDVMSGCPVGCHRFNIVTPFRDHVHENPHIILKKKVAGMTSIHDGTNTNASSDPSGRSGQGQDPSGNQGGGQNGGHSRSQSSSEGRRQCGGHGSSRNRFRNHNVGLPPSRLDPGVPDDEEGNSTPSSDSEDDLLENSELVFHPTDDDQIGTQIPLTLWDPLPPDAFNMLNRWTTQILTLHQGDSSSGSDDSNDFVTAPSSFDTNISVPTILNTVIPSHHEETFETEAIHSDLSRSTSDVNIMSFVNHSTVPTLSSNDSANAGRQEVHEVQEGICSPISQRNRQDGQVTPGQTIPADCQKIFTPQSTDCLQCTPGSSKSHENKMLEPDGFTTETQFITSGLSTTSEQAVFPNMNENLDSLYQSIGQSIVLDAGERTREVVDALLDCVINGAICLDLEDNMCGVSRDKNGNHPSENPSLQTYDTSSRHLECDIFVDNPNFGRAVNDAPEYSHLDKELSVVAPSNLTAKWDTYLNADNDKARADVAVGDDTLKTRHYSMAKGQGDYRDEEFDKSNDKNTTGVPVISCSKNNADSKTSLGYLTLGKRQSTENMAVHRCNEQVQDEVQNDVQDGVQDVPQVQEVRGQEQEQVKENLQEQEQVQKQEPEQEHAHTPVLNYISTDHGEIETGSLNILDPSDDNSEDHDFVDEYSNTHGNLLKTIIHESLANAIMNSVDAGSDDNINEDTLKTVNVDMDSEDDSENNFTHPDEDNNAAVAESNNDANCTHLPVNDGTSIVNIFIHKEPTANDGPGTFSVGKNCDKCPDKTNPLECHLVTKHAVKWTQEHLRESIEGYFQSLHAPERLHESNLISCPKPTVAEPKFPSVCSKQTQDKSVTRESVLYPKSAREVEICPESASRKLVSCPETASEGNTESLGARSPSTKEVAENEACSSSSQSVQCPKFSHERVACPETICKLVSCPKSTHGLVSCRHGTSKYVSCSETTDGPHTTHAHLTCTESTHDVELSRHEFTHCSVSSHELENYPELTNEIVYSPKTTTSLPESVPQPQVSWYSQSVNSNPSFNDGKSYRTGNVEHHVTNTTNLATLDETLNLQRKCEEVTHNASQHECTKANQVPSTLTTQATEEAVRSMVDCHNFKSGTSSLEARSPSTKEVADNEACISSSQSAVKSGYEERTRASNSFLELLTNFVEEGTVRHTETSLSIVNDNSLRSNGEDTGYTSENSNLALKGSSEKQKMHMGSIAESAQPHVKSRCSSNKSLHDKSLIADVKHECHIDYDKHTNNHSASKTLQQCVPSSTDFLARDKMTPQCRGKIDEQHGGKGRPKRRSRKSRHRARGHRTRSASSSSSSSPDSSTERKDGKSCKDGDDSPLLRVASCESVGSSDDNKRRAELGRRRGSNCGVKVSSKFPPLPSWAEQARDVEPQCGNRRARVNSEHRRVTRVRTTHTPLLGRRAKMESTQFFDPPPKPPPKPTRTMTMSEFNRYLADKRKCEEITKINRQKLKVDCHLDPRIMDTSYRQRIKNRQRLYEHNKIARDNLRFLETLQKPKSEYERDSHLKDFKKNCAQIGRQPDSCQHPSAGGRAARRKSRLEPLEPLRLEAVGDISARKSHDATVARPVETQAHFQ